MMSYLNCFSQHWIIVVKLFLRSTTQGIPRGFKTRQLMYLKQSYTWLWYWHAKIAPLNMGDPILYNQMQLNKKNLKFGESMPLLRYWKRSKKRGLFWAICISLSFIFPVFFPGNSIRLVEQYMYSGFSDAVLCFFLDTLTIDF